MVFLQNQMPVAVVLETANSIVYPWLEQRKELSSAFPAVEHPPNLWQIPLRDCFQWHHRLKFREVQRCFLLIVHPKIADVLLSTHLILNFSACLCVGLSVYDTCMMWYNIGMCYTLFFSCICSH